MMLNSQDDDQNNEYADQQNSKNKLEKLLREHKNFKATH